MIFYVNPIETKAAVMNETEKPFACAWEGCKMAFTNEDHLHVHKKKHDMALHLGIDTQNNTIVADQTPTPTRFIRNCEEVGLFQDLQNVNPFDETFRKATELAKSGSLHIPETSTDDTLHTPHIFPHIEEGNNINKFSRNISNEPEFTVTTIDDDLLKLNDKNTNDASQKLKNDIEDIEELPLSNESEKSERNNFLAHNDPVISSHNTLISNNNFDIPTPIPVVTNLTNSDIPPAVVNNLSDIIKQNCLNKSSDGEENLKTKLKEALKNRVKNEESESDDCDAMVIHETDSSPLFTKSSTVIKSSPKRVMVKHSIRENCKKKTVTASVEKSKQNSVFIEVQNKVEKKSKRLRLPVTQSQLERQRETNRAAQIRSREKKKYWINQMETEIEILKQEKWELWKENQTMKHEVVWLKTMLLYHKDCPVARDPQITEEINQLVRLSYEELQKKMQRNPILPRKEIPIRPNTTAAANIIAVTPVPITNTMLVQVPASVSKPISVLSSTSVSTCEGSSGGTVQLNTLPVLKVKPPSSPTSADESMASNAVMIMPKIIPNSVRSLTAQNITAQNPLNTTAIATNLAPNVVIKFPENTSLSSMVPRRSTRQSKLVNVNNRLKVIRKKERKLPSIKANPAQIIALPNTILPDDNYFILAKPKNFV